MDKEKKIYILYGVLVKHKEQIYVIFGKNKLETIVSEINQNQRKERHFSLCVDSRLHPPTHNMCLSIYNMYVIYMKPLCMWHENRSETSWEKEETRERGGREGIGKYCQSTWCT